MQVYTRCVYIRPVLSELAGENATSSPLASYQRKRESDIESETIEIEAESGKTGRERGGKRKGDRERMREEGSVREDENSERERKTISYADDDTQSRTDERRRRRQRRRRFTTTDKAVCFALLRPLGATAPTGRCSRRNNADGARRIDDSLMEHERTWIQREAAIV